MFKLFKFFNKKDAEKKDNYEYILEPYLILAYFLKKYNINDIRLSQVIDLFLLVEIGNCLAKKKCYFKEFKMSLITVENNEIKNYFLYKKYLKDNKSSKIKVDLLTVKENLSFYGDTYFSFELKKESEKKLDYKKIPKNIEVILEHYFWNYIKSYDFNNVLSSIKYLPFIDELVGYYKKNVNIEDEVIRFLVNENKYKYKDRKNIKF